MLQELLDDIEQHHHGQPITGIGHSLGGILTLQAANVKPGYFERIVLLDPPLFQPWKLRAIGCIQRLGLHHLLPPAKKALNRRTHFHSRAEARQHWEHKRLFQPFDPRAFEDYLTYGLMEKGEGIELAFSHTIESQIFATLVSRTPGLNVPMPVHFLYATKHDVLQPRDIASLQRRAPHWHFHPVHAHHLFPFEVPEASAQLINEIIQ